MLFVLVYLKDRNLKKLVAIKNIDEELYRKVKAVASLEGEL